MRLILLLAATIIAASLSYAAPCLPAPLSTYTAAGFTCEVGTAEFSEFSFFLQNGGAGDLLGEDDITVSPLSEPGAVGFRFSGEFQATGGPNTPAPAGGLRTNEYRFFFEVAKPGSEFLSVISRLNDPLRIVYNPFKFGAIFAANYAANDGAVAIAHDDDPGLIATEALNSERSSISSDLLLHISAGASAEGTTSPVGYASLASGDFLFEYRDLPPEIPEPSSWLMGLSALGGLGVLRYLRR